MWYELLSAKKVPEPILLGKRCRRYEKKQIEDWVRLRCPNQEKLKSLLTKARRKKYRENKKHLTDAYVRFLLCDKTALSARDIPQELVNSKRELIKLKRLIKGLENEEHEGSSTKTG